MAMRHLGAAHLRRPAYRGDERGDLEKTDIGRVENLLAHTPAIRTGVLLIVIVFHCLCNTAQGRGILTDHRLKAGSAECSVHTDIELFYSNVAGKRGPLEF